MRVVKVGGSLREAEALMQALAQSADPLIVVHGGGPRIGAWLERLGFETRFHQGLRVTPPEQMEAVEQVLTQTGKVLASLLTRFGRKALGLSGRDAALLKARPKSAALGRVGEVTAVNTALLEALLKAGLTPVIAPIGMDEAGPLNINADTAAGAVAGAFGAPVVFLTNVPGVLADPTDPSSLYPELTRAEVDALIQQGVIAGGMIPKVKAALAALEAGAPWARIASGTPPHAARALEGTSGTRIVP